MTTASQQKEIVIIGGGIIGCTSAYFLTRHPSYDPEHHKITLIEASEIAAGASGKAGGLLALWAYPRSIVPLSYGLHADLAKEHGGKDRWGYREVNCGQLIARGRAAVGDEKPTSGNGERQALSLQKRSKEAIATLRKAGIPEDLDWLVPEGLQAYEEMGGAGTTAQVHPYQFTASMAKLAQEKGANIVLGSVTGIDRSSGTVKSVSYKDKQSGVSYTIPATDVIVSAGPWTPSVFADAPIGAMRAHSVVIRTPHTVSPYALFTNISLPAGVKSRRPTVATPEIYARPDQTIYACGEGDSVTPLPDIAADVEVDQARCQEIIDSVGSISDELRHGEIVARQACYLPSVQAAQDGPLIGHTGIKGLYLAAGHTCWGIQNGPGTGKLISEFVFDGRAKSANIKSLDPRITLRV